MKKVLLHNRKRTSEFSQEVEQVGLDKKDELMALKLKVMNDAAQASGKLFELPIHLLMPDPDQPRKAFLNLEGLATSIKEKGLIQPLVVRPRNDEGQYQIIVGERRYHAAKMAGLATLPCILREEEDANILILQLLENDQREQVPPLEEAMAIDRLIQMGMPKKDVAHELGRDAAWLSLRLGLLEASDGVKSLLRDEKVTDLRTLHELKQLEQEHPELASQAIKRLQEQDFSGNFRSLIQSLRAQKNGAAKNTLANGAYHRVKKNEMRTNEWWIYLEGKRKPLKLLLDKVLARELKKSLDAFLRTE